MINLQSAGRIICPFQRRARRLRASVARHLPARAANAPSPGQDPFGPPRQRTVAVLFADVRDFTRLAETMPPVEVMEILRAFHRRMEAVVFAQGGILDSYIGDAVMALFGAGKPGPADATAALTCARAMLDAMHALNESFVRDGRPTLGIGIGLHYGPVAMGDIGSERDRRFAVIGDTVNSASRLERLTRTLNVNLVASRTLVDRVETEARPAADGLVADLADAGEQPIPGRNGRIAVLTLGCPETGPCPDPHRKGSPDRQLGKRLAA